MTRNALSPEEQLANLLQADSFPAPRREYRFHQSRKFRFDFCWPGYSLAVEVEGGVYTKGRHTRGAGLTRDAEKYNEAALLGWRVIRVTPEHIRKGQAVAWIKRAMEGVA